MKCRKEKRSNRPLQNLSNRAEGASLAQRVTCDGRKEKKICIKLALNNAVATGGKCSREKPENSVIQFLWLFVQIGCRKKKPQTRNKRGVFGAKKRKSGVAFRKPTENSKTRKSPPVLPQKNREKPVV